MQDGSRSPPQLQRFLYVVAQLPLVVGLQVLRYGGRRAWRRCERELGALLVRHEQAGHTEGGVPRAVWRWLRAAERQFLVKLDGEQSWYIGPDFLSRGSSL